MKSIVLILYCCISFLAWSQEIETKPKPALKKKSILHALGCNGIYLNEILDDEPIIVRVGDMPEDEEVEEKVGWVGQEIVYGERYLIHPEFPGGFAAMIDFIDSNFVYPPKDTTGTLGIVYVEFNIDTAGVVDSVKVIKGLTPLINAEAKRVVELFPNFIPGSYMGKKKSIRYTLPVKIKEIPKIYEVPFISAKFPGGFDNLAQFIQNNLDVSVSGCGGDQITGVVWIQFYVSKYGYVSNVTVRKGVEENFDKEAERVIKMIPNWIPAQNEVGENVPSYFTIPIKKQI